MTNIIKFPDNRTEDKSIITAYHEINGTDYIVFKTDKVDNGNKVVGVSYKPSGEERYQKIVDMEEWKKAKGILVDDIHDKQDNFTYQRVEGEVLVTEDYIHELALRDANLEPLEAHYQNYLNSLTKVETPVEANIPVVEENVIAENSGIVDNQANSVISEMPSTPQPVEPQIMEIPSNNQPIISEAPIISDVNSVFNEPVIETPVKETPAFVDSTPSTESVVANSYINKANQLISDFREVSERFAKNMEELASEMGRQLEEAHHINDLSKQTYDNAKQILDANNSEDLTRDLKQVA